MGWGRGGGLPQGPKQALLHEGCDVDPWVVLHEKGGAVLASGLEQDVPATGVEVEVGRDVVHLGSMRQEAGAVRAGMRGKRRQGESKRDEGHGEPHKTMHRMRGALHARRNRSRSEAAVCISCSWWSASRFIPRKALRAPL